MPTRDVFRSKPPVVQVKVAAGKSFADTVRAVRVNSGINVKDLGAEIKTMRWTRDGNLLLEFSKGSKSEAAATKLRPFLRRA